MRLVSRALLGRTQNGRFRKRFGTFKEKKEKGVSRGGGINGAGYRSAKTKLRNAHVLVVDDNDQDMLEVTYVLYTFMARSNRAPFLRFLRNAFAVFRPRLDMDMPEGWVAQQAEVTKERIDGTHDGDTQDDGDMSDTDARILLEMRFVNLDGAADGDISMLEVDAATDASGQDCVWTSSDEQDAVAAPHSAEDGTAIEHSDMARSLVEQERNTRVERSVDLLRDPTDNTSEQEAKASNSKASAVQPSPQELGDEATDAIVQERATPQPGLTFSTHSPNNAFHSRNLSSPHAFRTRRITRHVRFFSTPPVAGSARPKPTFPAFPPSGIPRPTTTQAELDAVLADVAHLPGIITSTT